MADKLVEYKSATGVVPAENSLWPLYGAGLENLGRDGAPMRVPMPAVGADELLVRHDAVGLCFSDIKVIKAGSAHPRIYRDMAAEPVVLGHEVSLTVVQVGENLRGQYRPGDRFIVQADIFIDGVSYAYGYEIQGGLSQYNVIDWRVLAGDHGNYLIPVQPETGYAESALTEPWACVIAAYQLEYRTGLRPGGTTWIIGAPGVPERAYTIGAGLDGKSHPARLALSNVPAGFERWLRQRTAELGMEVLEALRVDAPPFEEADDIVLLGADAGLVETVSRRLAQHGVLAVVSERGFERPVRVDAGRIHYNRWVVVGGTGPDIARAYSDVPVRSTLRPGGAAWFVGAGGPMGRMHVQRAIQAAGNPAVIVCSDVSDLRLQDLQDSFAAEAAARGIEFISLNPTQRESYAAGLARFRECGFDDILVLAPIAAVVAEAATWLGERGVMNLFAGLTRGTMAALELNDALFKGARVIGHSASTIDDLRLMLQQAECGQLLPNRSVAAVGSLEAACDGLQAVLETSFPGKVVIYPQIRFFPLTALPALKDKLPGVYALLKDGREWTVAAENEFLRQMLP